MKKTILILAVSLLIHRITTASNSIKTNEKVIPVKSTLYRMQNDSLEDYKKYKKETEKKILENEKKIADLKIKKLDGTKEENERYTKKVAALEEKNRELKKRINDYPNSKNAKWDSFKREFNHDMDELGKALKDLGKN